MAVVLAQPTAAASSVLKEDAGCVVCGERSNRVVWSENDYEAKACTCGALYISPRPAAGAVDLTSDAHPPSFYAFSAADKLGWLARYVPPGRFLEVGAGNGDFLEAARSFGHSIAAIEAHPERAEQLRQRLSIDVECALVEDSRWPDRSCDVVFHCDLLSHFEQPHLALRQMTRLLRPGGCLFFEVGLVAELAPVWYRVMGRLGLPRHRLFFSRRALVRLLADCGLRIEHEVSFSLVPACIVGYLAEPARWLWRRVRRRPLTTPAPDTPSALTERWREVADDLRYGFSGLSRFGGPQTALFIVRPLTGALVDGSGVDPE